MSAIDELKKQSEHLKKQLQGLGQNKIQGMDAGDYFFKKMINRLDPVEYCETVLRAHYPEDRRHLHENQIELVRAACNPRVRRVAALMARQAGKTESIASICGYLADNYPMMKIGIFTPRIQQAEVSIGRLSIFYQMNEEKLNNKIVKITKGSIELSNGSKVSAVSGSDQSNIEGLTFDVIILDEAQKISNYTWSERIVPMGGATNAKLIKIGTPKTRNHFYESFEGKASKEWYTVRRDWTECAQLWALDATMLPDKDTGEMRPYSSFVLGLMPKSLKQWYFPNNPEVWTDGEMSVEDFKTQYMLEFVTGAGIFLSDEDFETMTNGTHSFMDHGVMGERYVAGIDFAGSSAEGADFTHITVLRITPNGQRQKVFALEMQGTDYNTQRLEIRNIFGGFRPLFRCESIFCDYTGCGRAIVDILMNEDGLRQITPITFNASDTFTKSGMNLKNAMFDKFKVALAKNIFKYPSKEVVETTMNDDQRYMYNKMTAEWRDLEYEVTMTVNKKIAAPTGSHDDVCCADVLANFAAEVGHQKQMPKASFGRMRRF